MTVTLGHLAELIGGTVLPPGAGEAPDGGAGTRISGVELNAAETPEGGLFAALPGTRVHGASYADQSPAAAILTDEAGLEILKGAGGPDRPVLVVDDVRAVLGAVSAEIHGHPSEKLIVIGVTGTSGKTTTTYLLEGALLASGKRTGLIGTTGTRINGRPVPSHLTTPEAPALQRLFAQMLADGVTHVVMEVSSHALSLGRVDGVSFDVTCFLNLSQDHLDFHDGLEDYFDAKARLFRPESPVHAPRVVACVDDSWGRRMAEIAAAPGVTVDTVGTPHAEDAETADDGSRIAPRATWRAGNVTVADNGVQHVTLTGPGGAVELDVPLPGAFNIANASVAWAALAALGVDGPDAAAGISRVAVPGRMERIDEGQDFLAVVDYAHKPAAVGEVLRTLRAQTVGRVIAVVGAGGDRDSSKRPLMGAEAARVADVVIVTDDNPRTEDPAAIREAVTAGAVEAAEKRAAAIGIDAIRVENIGDRAEAIDLAIRLAEGGDSVVVAGKGHETGQEINGVMHHFDDREQVREALRRRAGREGDAGRADEEGEN